MHATRCVGMFFCKPYTPPLGTKLALVDCATETWSTAFGFTWASKPSNGPSGLTGGQFGFAKKLWVGERVWFG